MALNGGVTSEDRDQFVVYEMIEMIELIESKWVNNLRIENVS